MIGHPGREVLLAHADGELTGRDGSDVALHVSSCAACRAAVLEQRATASLFAVTLRALDDAEPAHWAPESGSLDAMIDRARVTNAEPVSDRAVVDDDVLPFRVPPATPTRAMPRNSPLRWAAVIALMATATASAAIVGVRLASRADVVPVEAPAQSVEPQVAAVIATPQAGELRVAVSGAGAGSRLFVAFEDGAAPTVAVEGGSVPRFTASDGRVDVDLRGAAATLRLTIPRTLRNVTVATSNGVLVTISGAAVSPAAAADTGVPIDPGRTSGPQ